MEIHSASSYALPSNSLVNRRNNVGQRFEVQSRSNGKLLFKDSSVDVVVSSRLRVRKNCRRGGRDEDLTEATSMNERRRFASGRVSRCVCVRTRASACRKQEARRVHVTRAPINERIQAAYFGVCRTPLAARGIYTPVH